MTDEIDVTRRPTVPDMPRVRTETGVVRRALSRQEAKRIRNLNTVAINQMTDGRERQFADMAAELKREKLQKANALAVLEACVRRYGQLAFDRSVIQGICARGRVSFDVRPDRITVALIPELVDMNAIVESEVLDSE
jgi:hypothetical protein